MRLGHPAEGLDSGGHAVQVCVVRAAGFGVGTPDATHRPWTYKRIREMGSRLVAALYFWQLGRY